MKLYNVVILKANVPFRGISFKIKDFEEILKKCTTDIMYGTVDEYQILDFKLDCDKISHTITDLCIINDSLICDIHILDTFYGKILKDFVGAGIFVPYFIKSNTNCIGDMKLLYINFKINWEK